MDYQGEMGHFLEKLSIWREESQRELSKIIQFNGGSVNKGIHELVEEVNELKAELSIIKKERNGLLETVNNLSNDIRLRNAESPIHND